VNSEESKLVIYPEIRAFKGEITILRDELPINFDVGTQLFSDDIIKTKKYSEISLSLKNVANITINSNSEIIIKEFFLEKEVLKLNVLNKHKIKLFVKKGSVSSAISKGDKSSYVILETPLSKCVAEVGKFELKHLVEKKESELNVDTGDIKIFDKLHRIDYDLNEKESIKIEEDNPAFSKKSQSNRVEQEVLKDEFNFEEQYFKKLNETNELAEYEYVLKTTKMEKEYTSYLIIYDKNKKIYREYPMNLLDEDKNYNIYKVKVMLPKNKERYYHRYLVKNNL
jgi:hypothetical protein